MASSRDQQKSPPGEHLAPLHRCACRVDEGLIDQKDRELFGFAETTQESWSGILQSHRNAATPRVGGERA